VCSLELGVIDLWGDLRGRNLFDYPKLTYLPTSVNQKWPWNGVLAVVWLGVLLLYTRSPSTNPGVYRRCLEWRLVGGPRRTRGNRLAEGAQLTREMQKGALEWPPASNLRTGDRAGPSIDNQSGWKRFSSLGGLALYA
jgi:hypothetical protein